MPSLSATVVATTKTEVLLKPTVKKQLQLELRAYARVKAELDAVEQKLALRKAAVEELLYETGQESLKIDGFTVTLVTPHRSVLDKKKLSTKTLHEMEAAMVDSISKSYVKVSLPDGRE